ncbi:MAG: SGNH/GDSL hydrolase family protein [Pseudobutyrivibrio ruminis]|uniref:SGNH/GDSL hydrolase family protein n=1 Tax=Pseudobutyrivibrio ruminis TaxID=46206 RepID=A0A927U828_9FIRM|nr:SGNH/GDSL hydrolase family protein [Pseudobutyrivibrio ruminis]
MREYIDYQKSICNRGNLYRIKQVMKRAAAGEDITVGFIGGSITQGSLATNSTNCYAYKTFEWWKENFKDANFTYINAGIGGTTSHFGSARVEDDLLKFNPDFVIVEFSVNDDPNEFFLETYEGLVRHIYNHKNKPALLLVSNVFYDTGANAQGQHSKVARALELPLVSMESSIYPAVRDGKIKNRDITPDDLHPNDLGHELVASVIQYFLDRTMQEMLIGEKPSFEADVLPVAITKNRYEAARRYNNKNTDAAWDGFEVDDEPQAGITDCFKNGWKSKQSEACLSLEVTGTEIAVQYRKYVSGKSPKAKILVDGTEVAIIDAAFDETWGDKLELTPVASNLKAKNHKVQIVTCEESNLDNPMYIVSIITAG